jgi:hypothetical protein
VKSCKNRNDAAFPPPYAPCIQAHSRHSLPVSTETQQPDSQLHCFSLIMIGIFHHIPGHDLTSKHLGFGNDASALLIAIESPDAHHGYTDCFSLQLHSSQRGVNHHPQCLGAARSMAQPTLSQLS